MKIPKFPKTRDALIQLLQSLCDEGTRIRGAVFLTEKRPTDILKRLGESRARSWGLQLEHGNPSVLQVSQELNSPEIAESESRVIYGYWEESQPSVISFYSAMEKDYFEYSLEKLYRYLKPEMYKVHLSTKNFRIALASLSKHGPGSSIRIREYTAKSLIADPGSTKRVRTDREWTDEEFKDVFDRLSDNQQWLSWFRCEVSGTINSSFRLARDLSFQCLQGVKDLIDHVLRSIDQSVTTNQSILNQRDRLSSPTGHSRPLSISFGQNAFSDKSENYRLIRTLNGLRDSSLSVYHPNPYLHASFLDYTDGSSCEIWVTTPSEILIVPKNKTTPHSLSRLCEHICDNFEEGEVREYRPA